MVLVPNTGQLLELIQQIYDAALERHTWASVIGAITEASGGHSGLMRLVDYRQGAVGIVATHGYDDHQLASYQQHFVHLDPYRERLASDPAGTLVQSDQYVPLDSRRNTEYFNDYELPADRIHALGVPLGREKDFVLYLGLSRGRAAGPYDEASLEFVRQLLPHLLRAVQIQRLIGTAVEARQLSESALDKLRFGVVLLSATGMVSFANSTAIELASQFGIRIAEAGLSLQESRSNAYLQRLIGAATAPINPGHPGTGGNFTYARPGRGLLQIRVFPFIPSNEPPLAGKATPVAVFLVRPGPCQLNHEELGLQFGLTPAESRLAAQLAQGETVAEAARNAGIAMATARSQLRTIFAKTGTRRQAELTQILLTSLAGLARDANFPGDR
ncbi:MAG: hypothetical protein E6R09_08630 [Rhodocyclaceae bacterium]|nr:MAG: hypothetical protein E6R09_08630 [Rhodocyclaceae bacterium]